MHEPRHDVTKYKWGDFLGVILNFKDKQSDYKVVFNTVDKKFELKHQSEVESIYQGFIKLESNVENPDVEVVYSAKQNKIDVIVDKKTKGTSQITCVEPNLRMLEQGKVKLKKYV